MPGIFGALISGQRADQNVEVPIAEKFGRRISVTVWGEVLDELIHEVKTDFLVRLLPAAEAKFDANLHVVTEELDGVLAFGCEVVRVNCGRDLKFFEPGARLLRIFAALGFVVKKLAVIDDAANGRGRAGGNFNQVETF